MTDPMPITERTPPPSGVNLTVFLPILVRVLVFLLTGYVGMEAAKAQTLATQMVGTGAAILAIGVTIWQAYRSRMKLLNTPAPTAAPLTGSGAETKPPAE